MGKGFSSITSEQRAINLAKAREAKTANTAARRASTLRQDFDDADYWQELARKYKLRLPPWGMACTVSKMRSFMHKAGMTETRCKAWLGFSLQEFVNHNPDWPLRSFCGLVLEQVDEEE